jgi:hypothetical protein
LAAATHLVRRQPSGHPVRAGQRRDRRDRQTIAPAVCCPADLNEAKTQLTGTPDSRAGLYCEYNARNADPPTDQTMEVGMSWTDATLPVKAEISLQDDVTLGPQNLRTLRSLWNSYA